MFDLKGKQILVTGATSGIGHSVAKRSLDLGAEVWVHGRSPEKVKNVTKHFGANAQGLVADMSSVKEIEAMAQSFARTGEHLDGLVINAGIGPFLPLSDMTEAEFDLIMNTNFKGAFFTIKHFRPFLRSGSSIVVNGSVVAKKGLNGGSVYGASKAALRAMTQSLAVEFAPADIRINVVQPGPVASEILDKQGITGDFKAELQKQYGAATLAQRIATTDEVADMIVFLLSDCSRYCQGAAFDVDGGFAQV